MKYLTIHCSAGLGALFLLTAVTGCSQDHPAPPAERNELVLRFFNSMKSGNAIAAAEQGQKLKAIDPANDFVVKLVAVQQSNAYVQEAQQFLNQNDVNKALNAIDKGLKRYPANRTLLQARTKLRQLRHAESLITGMKNAKNASAMRAALNAAQTGLADNMTPKLAAYLVEYRSQIGSQLEEEKKSVEEPVIAPLSFDEKL